MSDEAWTLDIPETFAVPWIRSAGNVTVTLVPPQTERSTGIIVGPVDLKLDPTPEPPPGMLIRDSFELRTNSETVSGTISIGLAEARYFSLGAEEYKITLQAIERAGTAGRGPRTWRFLLEQLPVGSTAIRWKEANRAVNAMYEAAKSNNHREVLNEAAAFLEGSCDLRRTPEVERWRAWATYHSAVGRIALGNQDGWRTAAQTLVAMADSPDPVVQGLVSWGVIEECLQVERAGDLERALECYVTVDTRFGMLQGMAVRPVARALQKRMEILRRLRRGADLAKVAEVVVERYASSNDPEIVKLVTEARASLSG